MQTFGAQTGQGAWDERLLIIIYPFDWKEWTKKDIIYPFVWKEWTKKDIIYTFVWKEWTKKGHHLPIRLKRVSKKRTSSTHSIEKSEQKKDIIYTFVWKEWTKKGHHLHIRLKRVKKRRGPKPDFGFNVRANVKRSFSWLKNTLCECCLFVTNGWSFLPEFTAFLPHLWFWTKKNILREHLYAIVSCIYMYAPTC